MTGFSTRCCRSLDLLGVLVALWLATGAAFAAQAGIEVRKASVVIEDNAYVVDAEFDIGLTPQLEDVLSKGVPLYFVLEFELIRPRWYWFNDRVVHLQQGYRLSYNALTRQYRLGIGNLHQNFSSLSEALEVMSRVRRRQDLEPGTLSKNTPYLAALRFRLDTSQLPKPFQLNALGNRDWNIGSDWHRWNLTP